MEVMERSRPNEWSDGSGADRSGDAPLLSPCGIEYAVRHSLAAHHRLRLQDQTQGLTNNT